MKRALVTGGAGFLGSHLCRRLLADGFDVTALDNLYTGSMRNVEDLLSNASFRLIKGRTPLTIALATGSETAP